MNQGEISLNDLTVVVPVRNAEINLPECLESVLREAPAEVIVVDGLSTDSSREIATRFGARVLSDEGRGLPHARTLGAEQAATEFVALVDSDVIFPHGGLQQLLTEFDAGGYDALQAALDPWAAPGYWCEALATHERWGRRRHHFGIAATVMRRNLLLDVGFDDRFVSGEDIDLRYRLEAARKRVGVASGVAVTHRYSDPSFQFARDQFEHDGRGLGRMVRAHGLRAGLLPLVPAAAALRGIGLSLLRRQPRWIKYYAVFAALNYKGILQGLLERSDSGST
ncbi:MAG: glycosyltransferase [Acidimicrobiia bacterium]|nr:glycosyltransferase [Acidimicrobiia bacterium]